MSSERKVLEKQLKEPDRLQVQLTQLLAWIIKNARALVLFVGLPVAAVVGLVFGWQAYQGQKKHGRETELGGVQVVYEAENKTATDKRQELQTKIADLDAKIQKASAPAPAAAPKEGEPAAAPAPAAAPDPKLLADKAALEKERDAVKADHTESAKQFMAFYEKYPTTPEGWVAGMTAARIAMEKEKYADARPTLEAILAQSKAYPFYQVQTRLVLMGLLEELGDYDKALAETEALEKAVDTELKPRVLLARGRIQLLKNAKDDAKKTFGTLIETHGSTPEAQKARSLQALIN
jgi:predicted negative regulator of RcsB-dependent stress response